MVFNTHTYRFGGVNYLHKYGSPIGLRLTGAVANIVMGYWSRCQDDILMQNSLEFWIKVGYVEDIRVGMPQLELGASWNQEKKRIKYHETVREEDMKRKNAEVVNAIMD